MSSGVPLSRVSIATAVPRRELAVGQGGVSAVALAAAAVEERIFGQAVIEALVLGASVVWSCATLFPDRYECD
jgi:hypothetical protein